MSHHSLPQDQRSSGTVRFASGTVRSTYEPRSDGWLVTAPIVCDPKSPPRPTTWRVQPCIAAALAAAYKAAGYRVIGSPKPNHMHAPPLGCALCQEYIAIWAREIFQRAGSRHRDELFASLLRVLDTREARQLAAAYDEVAA